MFYSDMSARAHNMNFPKSPLHNLISDVLCLRVGIAFWHNIQKFLKCVWHIRPDLDQNTK